MLSFFRIIINKYLDKRKIPYRRSMQIEALTLNTKHYILRNKIVKLNNLDEPLYSDVHDQLPPLPLEKYYFALVRELAKLPPTIHSNCSEGMCLHARAFLVAPGESPWLAGRIALVGQENWRRTLPLNYVRPPKRKYNAISAIANEIWQYCTGGNLTIFNKDRDTAEEGRLRSLKFLQPSIGVHFNC